MSQQKNTINSMATQQTIPSNDANQAAQDSSFGNVIDNLVQKNKVAEVGKGIDLVSFLAGIPLVVGFYVLTVPFRDTYLGELLSGAIPPAIMYLTFVALTALALKLIGNFRQTRAFKFDLVPNQIGIRINKANACQFLDYLHKLGFSRRNLLVNRLKNGLEFLSVRGKSSDVTDYLDAQSAIDSHKVVSGYGYISLIVWALPILGFIGTVLGIGASVSEFSGAVNAAEDMSIVKESLAGVTSGLGVSFNTTLLALVMSMLVMFPKKFVQQREESMLTKIDSFIQENFYKRLEAETQPILTGGNELSIVKTMESMQDTLSDSLDRICQRISTSISNTMSQTATTIATANQSMIDDLRADLTLPSNGSEKFLEEVARIEDSRVRALQQLTEHGNTALERINQSYQAILPAYEANSSAMKQLVDSQHQSVRELEPQLKSMLTLVSEFSVNIATVNKQVSQGSTIELSDRSQKVLESLCRSSKRNEALQKSQLKTLTSLAESKNNTKQGFWLASLLKKIRVALVQFIDPQRESGALHVQNQES